MRELTVQGEAVVHAPLQRMWLLSRRVELVRETLHMNAVGGVTEGFVEAGSRVLWRGWKFGLPTEHHTLITGFAPPHPAGVKPNPETERGAFPGQPAAWFQDSQEKGRFRSFRHDHWLREHASPAGDLFTELQDEVHFSLPLGLGGELVARALMVPYVRLLVRQRFERLRRLAEGDGWRRWLPPHEA